MATAMLAPIATQWEFRRSDDVQEAPAIEHSQRGASRLLQRHSKALDAEIEHATRLVSREREAEDEIYSQETLNRAVNFLKKHIRYAWEACGTTAPIPVIGPGPAKSVDLYWKQSSWKLLVNIPADDKLETTFYGDDYGRNKIEGSLDPTDLSRPIVSWLIA